MDATQIEINPFAQIEDGRGFYFCKLIFKKFFKFFLKVYCIDAKLIFDDNAAFRQKNIFELDTCEEMVFLFQEIFF